LPVFLNIGRSSSQYLEDSNTIEKFANEALLPAVGENKGIRPVGVYSLYSDWCAAHGIAGKEKANNIVLGKALSLLGYEKTRSNGYDYWCVKISPQGEEIMKKRRASVTPLSGSTSVMGLEAANQSNSTEDRLSA
jgi:hypothetical protein